MKLSTEAGRVYAKLLRGEASVEDYLDALRADIRAARAARQARTMSSHTTKGAPMPKGVLNGAEVKRVGEFLLAMPDQEVTVEVKHGELKLYATVNPNLGLSIALKEDSDSPKPSPDLNPDDPDFP